MAQKITIEPVTRVEGHGKVTIHLDDQNNVSRTRLHIVEFRGFERFVQGRPYWEAPVLVQRLCGICPVSHHLVLIPKCLELATSAFFACRAEMVPGNKHHFNNGFTHFLKFRDVAFNAHSICNRRTAGGHVTAIYVHITNTAGTGRLYTFYVTKRRDVDAVILGGIDNAFTAFGPAFFSINEYFNLVVHIVKSFQILKWN